MRTYFLLTEETLIYVPNSDSFKVIGVKKHIVHGKKYESLEVSKYYDMELAEWNEEVIRESINGFETFDRLILKEIPKEKADDFEVIIQAYNNL